MKQDWLDSELLINYCKGTITEHEKEALEKWLSADAEHLHFMNSFQQMWNEMDQDPTIEVCNDRSFSLLTKKIALSKKRANLRVLYKTMLAASVLLILMVGSFVVYQDFYGNKSKQYYAANGNIEVELPDHSIVSIHQGSRLQFSSSFLGMDRKVKLEGEAFFDVTKNPELPFVVETNGVAVRVLGTKFNLDATNESKGVRLAVVEGKVLFIAGNANSSEIIVNGGEMAEWNVKQAHFISSSIDHNLLFWKTGKLYFNEQDLTYVLNTISDNFGVNFKLDNPELRKLKLKAQFNGESLDDILASISFALNIEFIPNGGNFFYVKAI